ncbi:hypothetical protein LIER_34985 [Lithospermum erythrorhizon]|uniref:Uncharacterized protein n=1 Tax=Lithospermum erythrorhizon TaxID=34254 RepID=A0AAV3NHK6_LITER
MEPPAGYKDIRKLTWCLAALCRFISKSGEWNLPFFKHLRRASKEHFTWDEECARAFNELKNIWPSLNCYRGPTQWKNYNFIWRSHTEL